MFCKRGPHNHIHPRSLTGPKWSPHQTTAERIRQVFPITSQRIKSDWEAAIAIKHDKVWAAIHNSLKLLKPTAKIEDLGSAILARRQTPWHLRKWVSSNTNWMSVKPLTHSCVLHGAKHLPRNCLPRTCCSQRTGPRVIGIRPSTSERVGAALRVAIFSRKKSHKSATRVG